MIKIQFEALDNTGKLQNLSKADPLPSSFLSFLSPFLMSLPYSKNSNCIKYWSWTGFFGSWRLSFPYVALGVSLIMWPRNLWLSYVAGVQLLILALLRMFTVFRTNVRGREDSLLPEFDEQTDK